MKTVRIALAQINPIVGDLKGNSKKIVEFIKKASDKNADIVVFPELSVCGYPPEDLLLKPYFLEAVKSSIETIRSACKNITVVIGFPHNKAGKVYNSAAVVQNMQIKYIYNKMHLPNYGVFDEKRYFTEGKEYPVFHSGNLIWAVNICEDIWIEKGPTYHQASSGNAGLVINISASPYHIGKLEDRKDIIRKQAKKHNTAIAYCNLVGGQDELVFDGGSLIVSSKGNILGMGAQFEEDIVLADIEIKPKTKSNKKHALVKNVFMEEFSAKTKTKLEKRKIIPLKKFEEIYKALVTGTRDYVKKNGFNKVIMGLSGGIDSALTAIIAVDALGRENVTGISMPSQFSSTGTIADAKLLAKNLNIKFTEIPIREIFKAYTGTLSPHFEGKAWDITEENIQARIRGNILMAFSNKFGYLVLTTGNKSETSVGYCTLYGDMAGGFAIIKDVPKQIVYELSRYRNNIAEKELIPEAIFTRPPTAELRHNQKDEDSLPPYHILDPIIDLYVGENKGRSEIIKKGFNKETVDKIINLIDKSEYKRRQSPPGIKITPKAYGRDRRMPITCRFDS